MKTQKIREAFIEFFSKRGHTPVPSSSLVPQNDATLLFTNAGMVQFKDVFLGEEQRPYERACSIQKCVRAGGKHNDLENVGFTARHHTFFEMLGNFSFGAYFKKEAIRLAWELLTQVFKIPSERLWITVFDEDKEAEDIWVNDIGVNPQRISRIGAKDNFWSMGDTGPCGPCTEIFYDHGPEIPGGPPGTPDSDKDRYVEIWNLVFMQYNRDAAGKLTPLPKPSVDTGSGLERLAAVLQGVHDNYDIDLFKNLIQKIAKVLHCKDLQSRSLRVIADHIRAATFLISDGVMPGNEGRGYVLRRIIRRAIRHGYKLGTTKAFFYLLVQPVIDEMATAYPELLANQEKIMATLKQEEEQFAKTLSQGMGLFEEAIAGLKDSVIPGAVVFKLYDTYGFPMDLTADMAREHQLSLDEAGFEVCMNEQRERGRSHSKFKVDHGNILKLESKSEFLGYDRLSETAEIITLVHNGQEVDSLTIGMQGDIVLTHTPFYPEGGGQVGDQGVLKSHNAEFKVIDTQKQNEAIIHRGEVVKGQFNLGTKVVSEVDPLKRMNTARNHSATHLLHAALRAILGTHVEQKGSWVAPHSLRFDFSHPQPLSPEQKQKVEQWVNQAIALDVKVDTIITHPEEAKKIGAMALFGEKYGERVRVLKMGEHSVELCGGTHVGHTGDIGLFKITSESGIASGVRRIEALTSMSAKNYLEQELTQKSTEASELREQVKRLEKALAELKTQWVLTTLPSTLLPKAETLGAAKVLISELKDLEPSVLMPLVNVLKEQLTSAVIILALTTDDKVQFIVGVTKDLTSKIKANELIQQLVTPLGGKGGGRPELAQAGAGNIAKVPEVLQALRSSLQKLV
jgi:alanyl-tRNA synthetase